MSQPYPTVEALAKMEIETADYLRSMADGKSVWDLAAQNGGTDAEILEGRRHRNAVYQAYLREQDIDIAGVGELLAQLSERYAMAIVTTCKREDFELIHRDRDIVRHMQFVLTNGDYAREKPAPDPYLEALRRFGVAPEQAVVVEDSERGLRSALAAGIDCVVVANDFVVGHDFSAATRRIGSLAELPEVLAGM